MAKEDSFYMVYMVLTTAAGSVGLALMTFKISVRIGASPTLAAVITICVALGQLGFMTNSIIGTAVDSLHPKIDRMTELLYSLEEQSKRTNEILSHRDDRR